ncbi:restriction endonuclease subunit S [Methylotuvimicrobium sp. KM1]|uniref:restriction endonuclease subunit S n=1 Tax=Methylotuvimicrobium sp. KM1 TaxID=3377707 RepID=UPI00384B8460
MKAKPLKQKLEAYCEFINGGAWNEHEYTDSGIPVLKVSNIKNQAFSLEDIDYLSIEGAKKYAKNLLNEYDLIVATVGSHPNLINSAAGRTIAVSKALQGYLLNQNAVCIRTKDNKVLYQPYLRYIGETGFFRAYIQARGKGAANQMRIAIGEIKNFPISMPKLAIQKKIAAILSAYDDLIENNLKRIKLLEEMAQITYEEWFVRLKFPGHETTPVDSETGLPEGWLMNKVGNLLAKIATTTKIKSSEYCTEGKFPIIDQSREYIAGYTNDEDSIIDIRKPIIVFGDHTRILKLVNFPFARGADGTQILLSKDERMPQYLFYFSLLAIDLSNYHYARHFKFLKDCELILPDLNTALAFENLAAKNFRLIKNLRNQNQLLKEARNILLPRLMTGMIDVEQLVLPESLGELSSNLTQESQAA